MIIQTISIKSVTAQGMGTLSVFEGELVKQNFWLREPIFLQITFCRR